MIRVALVGYGLGGACFHAPIIRATAGLRIAAIVTSDPDRRAQARAENPDAAVLAGVDELWERADAFDLAVVVTPNRAHAPLATAALEAGLHVVVDKPLTPTAAEGRALVERARRRGRMLTVYHNRRWDAEVLTARRLLEQGELGDPLRLESRLERWRPEPKPGWRQLAAPEEAGGLLYDLGSHLIDQALALFGPAARVYAELDRRRPGAEVDDDAFVALTHRSGVRSHLWASAVAAHVAPRLRLLGSRAAYVKQEGDPQEAVLRGERRVELERWGREPPERWGRLVAGDESHPVPTEPGAWPRFYAGVVSALRDGAPPPVDPLEAVAVLDVIEAARRSAEEGRVVQLKTPTRTR